MVRAYYSFRQVRQGKIVTPLLHHTKVYCIGLQLLGGRPMYLYLVRQKFPTAEGDRVVCPVHVLGEHRSNPFAGGVTVDMERITKIRVN